MESCSKCGQPMVCGHQWSLDATRGSWRICCLCTAEMINALNVKEEKTTRT